MKKIMVLLFLVSTLLTFGEEGSISQKEKIQGYFMKDDSITFVFDLATNKENMDLNLKKGAVITQLSVLGSFNGWKSPEKWVLNKTKDGEYWVLTRKISEINIPGNSGHPEFKFYAEGEYEKNGSKNPTEAWFAAPAQVPDGYKFSDQFAGENNYLVIFPGEDTAAIAKDNLQAITVKKEFANDEDLTNFREVRTGTLGKGKLFRTYHPYIKSKKSESETIRLQKIQAMMEANGIKSIINLSDAENELKGSRVPKYYGDIIANKNIVLATTGYNDCYYYSNNEKFVKLINDITKFIIISEPPFLIHCRLGTDRTGVTTAFLEGFMGAKWSEIAKDYLRSNNVGMGEFRSEKLLKYSYENMLGIKINDETVIEPEIVNYLKTRVKLTDDEISKLKDKLK